MTIKRNNVIFKSSPSKKYDGSGSNEQDSGVFRVLSDRLRTNGVQSTGWGKIGVIVR
jgi:hypothetical protein